MSMRLFTVCILVMAAGLIGGCRSSRVSQNVEVLVAESETNVHAKILAVVEPQSVRFMGGAQTSAPAGQKWLVLNLELKPAVKASLAIERIRLKSLGSDVYVAKAFFPLGASEVSRSSPGHLFIENSSNVDANEPNFIKLPGEATLMDASHTLVWTCVWMGNESKPDYAGFIFNNDAPQRMAFLFAIPSESRKLSLQL